MNSNAKIYVAGHKGMVGSAIVRKLQSQGYSNLILKNSSELDLTNQTAVHNFFKKHNPKYVFLAAAKVGGILANRRFGANFIYQNLMIQSNVIHNSHLFGVKKLLFLGSSCIYPKYARQPIKEEYLLSDKLESSNEPYAISKIAGIKMCQAYHAQYGCNFIAVMPTNLYGYNDNYHLEDSHVLPALIRKFHEATVGGKPSVEIWGTGSPKREFLYSDDLADACIFLMKQYNNTEIINVGTGEDITIRTLTEMIQEVVGFKGSLVWNTDQPDGTPRKLMDVNKLHELGWKHKVDLLEGLKITYDDFKENINRYIP